MSVSSTDWDTMNRLKVPGSHDKNNVNSGKKSNKNSRGCSLAS